MVDLILMVHILIALQYDDKPKCQAAGCEDGFSCGPVQNRDTKETGYACCNVPDCFPASAKVALEIWKISGNVRTKNRRHSEIR